MAMENGAVEAPAAPDATAPIVPANSHADLTATIEDGLRRLTHAGAGVGFAEDGERLARVLTEIASQLGKHDAKLFTLAAASKEKENVGQQPADAGGASSEEIQALNAALDAMRERVGRLEEAAENANARAEAAEAKLESATRAVDFIREDRPLEAKARAEELRAVVATNGGGGRTQKETPPPPTAPAPPFRTSGLIPTNTTAKGSFTSLSIPRHARDGE